MLRSIAIRNFAIIEQLELEFDQRFTALTGETGAGKSILLGALGLALGARADSDTVRHGTERAEISAEFDISSQTTLQSWLQQQDLDGDEVDQLLVRRVVRSNGGSRAWINGHAATAQDLKAIGQRLVEIHGQHESQALKTSASQMALLDGAVDTKLKRAVAEHHQTLITLARKREQISQAADPSQLEFLKFQIRELDGVAISAEAWQALDQQHHRMSHAGDLMDSCQTALSALDDDDRGALAAIARAQSALVQAVRRDNQLAELDESLSTASIHLSEVSDTLTRYLADIENDPATLQQLESQVSQLHALARKHQTDPDQLLTLLQDLKGRYQAIAHSEQAIAAIDEDIAKARDAYLDAARRLSHERHKQAKKLSSAVTTLLGDLGMNNGQFHIQIDLDDTRAPSSDGLDVIDFQVSLNAAQPLRSLRKAASGGELARVALALKVSSVSSDVGTLIFDEVDTGVGGATAQIIGELLRKLGKERQVLCVTHLAQVAAQAHYQFAIHKVSSERKTVTRIRQLDAQGRVGEIARMLGGTDITEQVRSTASEMLDQAARAS